jgi:thioredoxin reductase (NADPH)
VREAIPYLVGVAIILVVFVWPAWRSFRREEAEARQRLADAKAAGRHEPVSIRPFVRIDRCMGSGACVKACPEGTVLQVIDGQARIVDGSHCVGHGSCVLACPTGGVELVFGSEKRGVDIPQVGPDFQSNVPGLYVVGELGGMGLIANAVKQGIQATQRIRKSLTAHDHPLDLVIVGAGPAGLAAAMIAKQRGLRHVLLEQGEFGGAIRHYPRQKIVLTRPFQLPGQPEVRKRSLTKEELIELLEEAVEQTGLQIDQGERVLGVDPLEVGGFDVRTSRRTLRAAKVVLAVGRRGTPRKLEVPGEERSKVAYRLLDPELYQHCWLLVVGGGDSAVEAAIALSEQPGNRVTLSYRRDALTRPKAENLARLDEAKVELLLGSQVVRIGSDRVELSRDGEAVVVPNDQVFVFAGGILPTAFLADAGIELERHFGQRIESVSGAPGG